jgi:hypothetical protein
LVDPTARYEEFKIPLRGSARGFTEVSAVMGIPQWWPTGQRVGVVIAHGLGQDISDPTLEQLQEELTERHCLTLRFNFPFGEAGKKRPDSQEILQRTFRAAIDTLSRDPNAVPAQFFFGGFGIGGQIAAELAAARARVDGIFMLGFPLHPMGKPELADSAKLFRIISPMLFLQGARDRHCDIDTLRQTLTRVGTPTTLQIVKEADHQFKVLKKSGRTDEEIRVELVACVSSWVQKLALTGA